MRKTQGPGRRPADRIVLRAERVPDPRPTAPVSRPFVHPARCADRGQGIAPRDGVTMDYQMGFTSGPSN
jgi:hypothetical protein